MKRRDFLRYLLSTPVAAFVDYEKLLWVPEEKKIFVPEFTSKLEMLYGGARGPGKSLSGWKILEIEIERFSLSLPPLFDRDSNFYEQIKIP